MTDKVRRIAYSQQASEEVWFSTLVQSFRSTPQEDTEGTMISTRLIGELSHIEEVS